MTKEAPRQIEIQEIRISNPHAKLDEFGRCVYCRFTTASWCDICFPRAVKLTTYEEGRIIRVEIR